MIFQMDRPPPTEIKSWLRAYSSIALLHIPGIYINLKYTHRTY